MTNAPLPASAAAKALAPHLLVVDDDPDMLRLLTMRLSAAGYRVTVATSAEAAMTQMHIERPQLVLSDVRLPGRDGLGLFDDIRAQHPSLPVILLTAHGTIPDAVEATERGVFTYLTKPFDGKALLEKIAQALALSAPTTTAPRMGGGGGGYSERLEAFRQSDAEREQMVTELLRNFEQLRDKYEQMEDDLGNERESRRMWQSKANSSDRALVEQRQASVCVPRTWRKLRVGEALCGGDADALFLCC